MSESATKKRFTEVYTSESDALFRFCIFRISGRENALDITQEAFMRYWDALSSGKEIKNDKAFLFTICRNLIIDFYRKKKSISLDAVLDEMGESSAFVEDKDSHINSYTTAEARFVMDKLEELEPGDKQVIYLRFIEGFKPKDIAEILQVSSNVVSVRITRALEKLREVAGFNLDEE